MAYYAHSGETRSQWEPLAEHLTRVSERAASFASAFSAANEARLAGLLHDIGKYGDLFQARLEGRESGLDHWSAGAWIALTQFRSLRAALAAGGHHTGLPRADPDSLRSLDPQLLGDRHPLQLRLTEADPRLLLDRLRADGLELPLPDPPAVNTAGCAVGRAVDVMLDVRMLFSALVDADYLETEAHFNRDADGRRLWREPGQSLQDELAESRLHSFIQDLTRRSTAAPGIQSVRTDLLEACLVSAECAPGLFTLSAPTGAGKTLAMLAFALRHCKRHGLRRIVLAVPYLSIIEQTARVFRDVFGFSLGADYILEHHSLAGTRGDSNTEDIPTFEGGERQSRRAALLSENWDAPIVVTTSVQLLESLFANRPGACRKLHRLAQSVILLDEVQTLPTELAVPTLAALSRLAKRYQSTVVFATATQPAFEHLDPKVRELSGSGWQPRPIVPDNLDLASRCRRVRVNWSDHEPVTWADLAVVLGAHRQALCIVNLKRDAVALVEQLRENGTLGLRHLSTNMCPAHRQIALDDVRRRLDRGEPCLLVSTQCVEAGVDVDFPVVYRAMAPLDAIAQAAGRCNRNGRTAQGGLVVVFRPDNEAFPRGGYDQAAAVTRILLQNDPHGSLDIDDPRVFAEYYRTLYSLTNVGAQAGPRAHALADSIGRCDFPETARNYRLIPRESVNVLVPFHGGTYVALRDELERVGRANREWFGKARAHAVSIYRPRPDDGLWAYLGAVPLARGLTADDWFVHLDLKGYDGELLGLRQASDVWIA